MMLKFLISLFIIDEVANNEEGDGFLWRVGKGYLKGVLAVFFLLLLVVLIGVIYGSPR